MSINARHLALIDFITRLIRKLISFYVSLETTGESSIQRSCNVYLLFQKFSWIRINVKEFHIENYYKKKTKNKIFLGEKWVVLVLTVAYS